MLPSGSKTVNFSFLSKDIRNQIMHSRSLVESADRLKEIASTVIDETQKAELLALAEQLIKSANELAANAESTTTSASSVVGFISRSST